MLSKKQHSPQTSFYSSFEEQLNHKHPLYILANRIDWKKFDEAFAKHYAPDGRPEKFNDF